MDYVYFIQCGGLVKIGSASDVRARLSNLQVASAAPLTLLAIIPNEAPNNEFALHKRFHQHHHRGEWFALEGALAEFVEALPPYRAEPDGRSLLQTGRDGLFNFRAHPGLREACMAAAKEKKMKLAEWMEFHLLAALESEGRDTSFMSEPLALSPMDFGADSLEPAPGDTLDFDDFFNAYVAAAEARRLRAFGPTEFVGPFKALCEEAGIRVSSRRRGLRVQLYLANVRLAA